MTSYNSESYSKLQEQVELLLDGSPWSFRVYDINDADVGGVMSTRVKKAMALDAIEAKVKLCGKHVLESAKDATHFMNVQRFEFDGFVMQVAGELQVPYRELWPTALAMLKAELDWCLIHERTAEVESVKPFMEDGKCVGLTVTFYKDIWKRSA